MTAVTDQSCFSCSAYKFLLPTGSSLTSLFFFFNKMTGAYVSGRKMIMMIVHTPAKIIITQNTNLQEAELSRILKRKLSYVFIVKERITYYPETTGPATAPIKRPAPKRVVTGPRPTADQISAMTPIKTYSLPVSLYSGENYLPPQFVKGATEKKPDKNQVAKSVCMLGTRACPM